MEEVQERMRHNFQKASEHLRTLLYFTDPVELFVGTVASMIFVLPEDMIDSKIGTMPVKTEYLAYELYPHFPPPSSTATTGRRVAALNSNTIYECRETLDALFIGHTIGSTPFLSPDSSEEDILLEAIGRRAKIVRGKSYPAQSERRIREVQGRFDSWYEQNVGVSPTRVVDIINAILKAKLNAFNVDMRLEAEKAAASYEQKWRKIRKKPKRNRDEHETNFMKYLRTPKEAYAAGSSDGYANVAYQFLPVSRTKLDVAPTEKEWDALQRLIGLTTQRRAEMTDPVEVRNFPLYVLPDGRVLLGEQSNALDALWEAFDTVARQDQKFYDKRYQKHAASWLESQAIKHLRKIFPAEDVYQTLDYPDPNQGPKATAELDAAILWGPFLLLIEAKAKQFRLAGQLGDIGRLRTDLKQNVEDAFQQALRARDYVEQSETPTFTERSSGRKLVVDKSNIERVYLLTVSLHELSALTTRLAVLKPLNLFQGKEYPFAIGESDLEIISELLPGPEVFLHYVEKRTAIHSVKSGISADELDLLAVYLDTRFVSDQLWDNTTQGFDYFGLDGYSDRIDQWARYHWKVVNEPTDIKLKIPDEISTLLSYLRTHPSNNARWVAFNLLDMKQSLLEALAEGIDRVRENLPGPGKMRRYVAADGDQMICIVASNRRSFQDLAETLSKRTIIERYRRKARKVIGFGIAAEDPNPITIGSWEDEEWRPDPRLDKLVEEDVATTPIAGSKLPGRNQPCFCGSGKKFKKCCEPRITAERRKKG